MKPDDRPNYKKRNLLTSARWIAVVFLILGVGLASLYLIRQNQAGVQSNFQYGSLNLNVRAVDPTVQAKVVSLPQLVRVIEAGQIDNLIVRENLLDTAYHRAKRIVVEQQHKLESLAQALLEHETVDRSQFELLMT